MGGHPSGRAPSVEPAHAGWRPRAAGLAITAPGAPLCIHVCTPVTALAGHCRCQLFLPLARPAGPGGAWQPYMGGLSHLSAAGGWGGGRGSCQHRAGHRRQRRRRRAGARPAAECGGGLWAAGSPFSGGDRRTGATTGGWWLARRQPAYMHMQGWVWNSDGVTLALEAAGQRTRRAVQQWSEIRRLARLEAVPGAEMSLLPAADRAAREQHHREWPGNCQWRRGCAGGAGYVHAMLHTLWRWAAALADPQSAPPSQHKTPVGILTVPCPPAGSSPHTLSPPAALHAVPAAPRSTCQ